MKQAWRALWLGVFGASLGVSGCGPSTASSGGDGGGGRETGPGPGPEPTPVATCAAQCTTDLVAARTALTQGDYQRAFELYRCADTPEAAFGAGLTRALLAFEGNNADALLADFGEPPLPATDIFGSNGILGRTAARWTGEGSLTVTGGLSVSLPFDRAMHEVSDDIAYSIGSFVAEDRTSPAHGRVQLSFDNVANSPFTSGAVLAITNTCTTSFGYATVDPRLGYADVEFDIGDTNYWCSLPYSLTAAECQTDGGNIVVTAAATAPGQPASYQLNNVMLACDPSSDTPDAPDDTGTQILVRVNGTLSATAVSEQVDTTGLHPLFGTDYSIAAHVPPGNTLTAAMQDGGAAFAELEEAACFFKIAARGSGHVYDVPGVLFGGSDVPISKGDTEIVAAFALLGAAAGHLAWVHEIDMQLNQIICEQGEGQQTCPTDEQFVGLFNEAFASDFHPGRLLVVERLTAEALALLDQGLADLDATSLLVRNAESAAGLDAARTLVQASLQSIQNGALTLPRITPALNVNLKALFEQPRNPRSAGPIMKYELTCDLPDDPDSCYSDTYVDPAFLERYFAGRIDADWEGEYEWADSDAFGDAAQVLGDSANSRSVPTLE